MPSTHTSLHYHVVFSTTERRAWIESDWRERLYAYLGGSVRTAGGLALSVGGTSDHVHLLIGLRATHRLSDVVRDIKAVSSQWVHQVGRPVFSWQDGYGAFTVSPSLLETVKRYIEIQEEHHRRRTYQEEYLALLRRHGVAFDERYLW